MEHGAEVAEGRRQQSEEGRGKGEGREKELEGGAVARQSEVQRTSKAEGDNGSG
jgi:hypothetical protein